MINDQVSPPGSRSVRPLHLHDHFLVVGFRDRYVILYEGERFDVSFPRNVRSEGIVAEMAAAIVVQGTSSRSNTNLVH